MRTLINIITLAGLLILTSCGSNAPSKQKLENCMELGNCETLVETRIEALANITKNGNTFEYVGSESSTDLILKRIWGQSNLVRNGKVFRKIVETIFTITEGSATILNQWLVIDPATEMVVETNVTSEIVTSSVELENGNFIIDDDGIDVTVEIL